MINRGTVNQSTANWGFNVITNFSSDQKRRLEFHPDRVDYYKIDADKRSGTIPIAGVR